MEMRPNVLYVLNIFRDRLHVYDPGGNQYTIKNMVSDNPT